MEPANVLASVGTFVPDFEMETYEPSHSDFGKVSLADIKKSGKWTILADTTGAVSRLFGVYDAATGLALRGTFIINPEGKLVTSEVNFYNVGRKAEELVRKMEANVHLIANPNEACPANWTPGAKTLRPGKDIVGNVAAALAD